MKRRKPGRPRSSTRRLIRISPGRYHYRMTTVFRCPQGWWEIETPLGRTEQRFPTMKKACQRVDEWHRWGMVE